MDLLFVDRMTQLIKFLIVTDDTQNDFQEFAKHFISFYSADVLICGLYVCSHVFIAAMFFL